VIGRHEKMVAAAEMLARTGCTSIGWSGVADGKGPKRHWKKDATSDPAGVAKLLPGAATPSS
jgi:hypothetical protein